MKIFLLTFSIFWITIGILDVTSADTIIIKSAGRNKFRRPSAVSQTARRVYIVHCCGARKCRGNAGAGGSRTTTQRHTTRNSKPANLGVIEHATTGITEVQFSESIDAGGIGDINVDGGAEDLNPSGEKEVTENESKPPKFDHTSTAVSDDDSERSAYNFMKKKTELPTTQSNDNLKPTRTPTSVNTPETVEILQAQKMTDTSVIISNAAVGNTANSLIKTDQSSSTATPLDNSKLDNQRNTMDLNMVSKIQTNYATTSQKPVVVMSNSVTVTGNTGISAQTLAKTTILPTSAPSPPQNIQSTVLPVNLGPLTFTKSPTNDPNSISKSQTTTVLPKNPITSTSVPTSERSIMSFQSTTQSQMMSKLSFTTNSADSTLSSTIPASDALPKTTAAPTTDSTQNPVPSTDSLPVSTILPTTLSSRVNVPMSPPVASSTDLISTTLLSTSGVFTPSGVNVQTTAATISSTVSADITSEISLSPSSLSSKESPIPSTLSSSPSSLSETSLNSMSSGSSSSSSSTSGGLNSISIEMSPSSTMTSQSTSFSSSNGPSSTFSSSVEMSPSSSSSTEISSSGLSSLSTAVSTTTPSQTSSASPSASKTSSSVQATSSTAQASASVSLTPTVTTKPSTTVSLTSSSAVTTKASTTVSLTSTPTVSTKPSTTVSLTSSSTVTTKPSTTVSLTSSPTVSTKPSSTVSLTSSSIVTTKPSSTVSLTSTATVTTKASTTISATSTTTVTTKGISTTTTKSSTSLSTTQSTTQTSIRSTTTVSTTSTTVRPTTVPRSLSPALTNCTCSPGCTCADGWEHFLLDADGALTQITAVTTVVYAGEWRLICGKAKNASGIFYNATAAKNLGLNMTEFVGICCTSCIEMSVTKKKVTEKEFITAEMDNVEIDVSDDGSANLNFGMGQRTGNTSWLRPGNYTTSLLHVSACSPELQTTNGDPLCPVASNWTKCDHYTQIKGYNNTEGSDAKDCYLQSGKLDTPGKCTDDSEYKCYPTTPCPWPCPTKCPFVPCNRDYSKFTAGKLTRPQDYGNWYNTTEYNKTYLVTGLKGDFDTAFDYCCSLGLKIADFSKPIIKTFFDGSVLNYWLWGKTDVVLGGNAAWRYCRTQRIITNESLNIWAAGYPIKTSGYTHLRARTYVTAAGGTSVELLNEKPTTSFEIICQGSLTLYNTLFPGGNPTMTVG